MATYRTMPAGLPTTFDHLVDIFEREKSRQAVENHTTGYLGCEIYAAANDAVRWRLHQQGANRSLDIDLLFQREARFTGMKQTLITISQRTR